MTDLDSRPLSEPVASETIVIKPNIQNTITESMGNKNIDFFFPDYLGYFLPSQSYISMVIEMQGRGLPIPSNSAGFHSLFNTIRSYDGTNSNLLSEMVQYNTAVAQTYTYSNTDALQNSRIMFEGLQAIDCYDNNLYWELEDKWSAQAFNFENTGILSFAPTPKKTQINSTLKTFLLSTEKFVNLAVMNGMRTSLQVEDYRRSLEFTSGQKGVQSGNKYDTGMCPMQHGIRDSTATSVFTQTTDGATYQDNHVYPLLSGVNVVGYVNVGSTTGGVPDVTKLTFVCGAKTGSGNFLPPTEDNGVLNVGTIGGGGPTEISKVMQVQVAANTIFFGSLSMASTENAYFVDIGVYDISASLQKAGSPAVPANLATAFGEGSLRSPFRVVNPIPNVVAGCGANSQFPCNNNPFVVGDYLYVNRAINADSTTEVPLGVITGFSKSHQQVNASADAGASSAEQKALRVYFQPNSALIPPAELPDDTSTTGSVAPSTNIGTFATNFDATTGNGYQLYVKASDRVSGTPPNLLTNIRANPPAYSSNVIPEVDKKVGFQINELQYQVKKVELDPRIMTADMNAANGSGYTMDIEESFTQLANVNNTLGPTNQLISNPNITRALGVLSVPLDQDNQFDITKKSLNGNPSNLTNYQYDMGTDGRQPIRAVACSKASLSNPLIDTQHISELVKTNEAFGYFTSNLSKVGLNFAVGRCFSRPNMFYDLMKAGSLMLLANYETQSSGSKLFIHYIHHLRSITFSRMGVSIAN